MSTVGAELETRISKDFGAQVIPSLGPDAKYGAVRFVFTMLGFGLSLAFLSVFLSFPFGMPIFTSVLLYIGSTCFGLFWFYLTGTYKSEIAFSPRRDWAGGFLNNVRTAKTLGDPFKCAKSTCIELTMTVWGSQWKYTGKSDVFGCEADKGQSVVTGLHCQLDWIGTHLGDTALGVTLKVLSSGIKIRRKDSSWM